MVFWFIAITAMLLVGCSKHSEAPANALGAQGRTELSQTQAPPNVNTQVSPSSSSEATEAQMTATLTQLTRDLRRWVFEHRRAPKSFEEYAIGASVPIPDAPPGKKYEIVRDKMQVILVNR
jgi:hypothetical protein